MYQFIHLEIYAESISKKTIHRRSKINSKGQKNSGTKTLQNIRSVIAEAKREPGAHPHVTEPQPPTTIFGIELDEVEKLAIACRTEYKDAKDRKLRTDTPTLLAGTTSYPRESYESNPEKFEEWLNDSVEWLKKHYENNLQNITLHLDEEHPHLHFYAISTDGKAKSIHAGYLAERNIDSGDTKARKEAHQAGMRKFQDSYYLDVAVKNGMLRDGPKRRRLSQPVYKAEKAHAQLMASKMKEINDMDQLAGREIVAMHDEMMVLAKQKSEDMSDELIDVTMQEADSIIESANRQIRKMLANAKSEADRIVQEAMQWSKNAIENIRKMTALEAEVKTLTAANKDTQDQLEYFVDENRDLKRQVAILSKKAD